VAGGSAGGCRLQRRLDDRHEKSTYPSWSPDPQLYSQSVADDGVWVGGRRMLWAHSLYTSCVDGSLDVSISSIIELAWYFSPSFHFHCG
jgi:hypothetical protein